MLGWKAIVENYIIRYSNQIGKVTRPLKDHFGISYFTYHQIDANGKYTVKFLKLSHRTVEFYFENIKNKTNCLDKREVLELAKNLAKLGFL